MADVVLRKVRGKKSKAARALAMSVVGLPKDTVMIQLKRWTLDELKRIKRKRETFDDLLWRLIQEHEGKG